MHPEKKRDIGLESLTDLPLYVIFTKLDAKDLARVACVSTRLRDLADEGDLWSKICFDELHMMDPTDIYGNPCIAFKSAYNIWREAFLMYPWCLVKRVKRCWDRIKTWLANSFPEAAASLREGATEADIEELENTLKVKLPVPTRILYRLHDGQAIKDGMNMTGLIGGHWFARHRVNVSLLPLKKAIALTQKFMRAGLYPSTVSKYIVVAVNSIAGQWDKKMFLLDCVNGQLYVWSDRHHTEEELIPCVPNALISSVHQLNGDHQQDAMLLWLEEHGRRLQSGIIKLNEQGNVKSIDPFPEMPALCSTAITNGVQVRACAMFIPEWTTHRLNIQSYYFLYSICMSLLPQGYISNGMPFSSFQPYRRHWVICETDVVVYDKGDEGNFPIMDSSNREFVYEHLLQTKMPSGSMEGFFTCVPGRLDDPKGSPFEVRVMRFPIQVPDYVF